MAAFFEIKYDNLLASYVHGEKIDEIICKITPGNPLYYHHDALGNVTLLTNDSGQLIEHYIYDAFGKPTILNATNGTLQTSAYGNRFLFTGREYLKEIGLYDYRNRIYSPELGRFLQVDPIGLESDDFNLYRYCLNNPINFKDSQGTSTDQYVPDADKHGDPHVDRYNKNGNNVGRYRPDGTPIDHKGKTPPKIPKSDLGKFGKAAKKLLRRMNNICWWLELMNQMNEEAGGNNDPPGV